jgi:surface carbohydrate biosynthesis protein (TIGR04326 family)
MIENGQVARNVLEIWSIENCNLASSNKILLWNGYEEKDNLYSILSYVEKNNRALKKRFVTMISDIASSEIKEKKIIDYFRLKSGFNYWWMTLLVEKSIWKTPSIIDAIKLIAAEDYIRENSITELIYYGKKIDSKVRVFKDLCQALHIKFKVVYVAGEKKNSAKEGFISAHKWAPHLIQACFVFIKYLTQRWEIRKFKKRKVSERSRTTIFSYLIHLDETYLKKGKIYSNQWGALPNLLKERGEHINWINQYLPSRQIKRSNDAVKLVEEANGDDKENTHFLLDGNLSTTIILRVMYGFIKLFLISLRTSGVCKSFRPRGGSVNLWPILKNDWYSSLRGKSAVHNLISIELYDSALKDLPRQRFGYYLQENQAWERSLIYHWRKYGHGVIFGVPHSSRSFWDLRFSKEGPLDEIFLSNPMYRPNFTIINGPLAKKVFQDENYEIDELVECETLRYNYLHNTIKKEINYSFQSKLKVGIFGDFSKDVNDRLVREIAELSKLTSSNYDYIFKPHPGRDVAEGPYIIDHSNLEKILPKIDIAIVSSRTSAGLEVFLAGIAVIVLLDEADLNLSPLKDVNNVYFAKNYIEIEKYLKVIMEAEEIGSSKISEIFYCDKNLSRWNKFLNNFYDQK